MTPCPGARENDFGFSLYGAKGPAFTMEQLESKVPSSGHAALFRTVAYREPEGDRSMIRNAEWKLVHDPMGDLDEFYCLESDPWEHCNLARDSRHAAVRKELMSELYRWRQWS